jgi:hypothetical protein
MTRLSLACVLACGCGPRVLDGDGGESSDADTGTSASVGSSGSSATTNATGASSGATTNATSATTAATSSDTSGSGSTGEDTIDPDGEGEGCGFICVPDGCSGYCGGVCDPWAQDCPRGEKCMPWANDGGPAWNDVKCSPLARDPRQPGEPCTVEGSGVSGIDDCDVGAMCWEVDPETNMGTCVAMCSGSPDDPQCPGECDVCRISGEGVLIVCLPSCDPLGAPCPAGEACYPAPDGLFACLPDGSGPDEGGAGSPCYSVDGCDPGLFCSGADLVPGCEGGVGCCAPYCDTAAADPCPGAAPGVACVSWWEEGQEPMDGCNTGTLGACVLP